MKKFFIRFLKKLECLDSIAVRLTVMTGKSAYPIHPKHLVKLEPSWFLRYLKREDEVLDLGCDNGMHSLKAAKLAKKVVGVDYNEVSLNIAKNLARDEKIKNIKFVAGSLEEKLPFKNNSFDKTLFLDVLEHLNKRSQIMREVYRVIKKGGLLMLSIPNSQTNWKKLQRKNGINSFADRDHKIEYTKNEAEEVCARTGFKIISNEGITYDTPLSPIFGLVGGLSLNFYKNLLDWKKNKLKANFMDTVGFRIVAQK